MIAALDHLVLTVSDLDRTLDFYARLFGMRVERAEGRPAALHFGSQKINVHAHDRMFEPKARRPTPGSADLCLVTDLPLAEARARIEAEGVPIELGPVARTGARGAMHSVYLRDPDGNLIEVCRYDG